MLSERTSKNIRLWDKPGCVVCLVTQDAATEFVAQYIQEIRDCVTVKCTSGDGAAELRTELENFVVVETTTNAGQSTYQAARLAMQDPSE